MRVLNNRNGYAITEMVVAMLIMSFLLIGITEVMIDSGKLFQYNSVQTYSDIDAEIALQHIVNDIREAKSYAITTLHTANDMLTLTYPKVNTNGTYDRTTIDPNNTVTYYLSDATGKTANTGTCLWRTATGDTARIVRRDIGVLSFATDTTRTLMVSVTAKNRSSLKVGGTYDQGSALTALVSLMRNY